MQPLLFVAVLLALSLAMVFVMVQLSRTYLEEAPRRRGWSRIYVGIWLAIVGWCLAFAGPQPMVFVVPIAFLAVHALIVKFILALKHAPPGEPDSQSGDLSEEDVAPPPAPHELTRVERIALAIRNFLQWVITIAAVLLIIGIGENIPALRRLDAVLAPHRTTLVVALSVLLAVGFALFMASALRPLFERASTSTERGIEDMHARRAGFERARNGKISLVELRNAWRDGTWRDRRRVRRFYAVIVGVTLALMAGAGLGLVLATPGIKLLVLVMAAFVLFKIVHGLRVH